MKLIPGTLLTNRAHSGIATREDSPYFFLETKADDDPSVSALQHAIVRQLPSIRNHIRRMFGDESRLEDVVDRLYIRLRNANLGTDISEGAIWSRLVSIVHEERRRERRRFEGTEATRMEALSDPESLAFVTELVRKDQLRVFRDCLDIWTRQAFDLRFSTPEPLKSKEMAKRLKMNVNAFDQRWRRGITAGLEEFRRRQSS